MKVTKWLRNLKRIFQYIIVAFGDGWRYIRCSSLIFDVNDAATVESKLNILAHKIEKGLALPVPKKGFGQPVVKELMRYHEHLEKLDSGSAALRFSLGALSSYLDAGHLFHLNSGLAHEIEEFVSSRKNTPCEGGLVNLGRKELLSLIPEGIEQFFLSRHSVRDFSQRPVNRKVILSAVQLAQRSPSVCNRQPWRVYIVQSEKKKKEVLSFQNGNSGFGHSASAVLLVTVPLKSFHGPFERNEAFVDGGIFSMSLIWALHALGLGSCALNWCASKKRDNGVRAALGVPKDEVVIMMIAVGHLKEQFSVARSPRRPVEEVVVASGDG